MPSRRQGTVPEHPPELPQLCRYLAERSPQPMVAVEGPTHLVRYANPAFCQLVGAKGASLIGRSFVEAVPEGVANRCIVMLDRVFATGEPEVLAEQEHRPNALGKRREALPPVYWSYLAWVILSLAGEAPEKPVGVMIQVTDTTEIAAFRAQAAAINEQLLLSGVRQHELTAEADLLNAELIRSEAQERGWRLMAQKADRSKDIFLATLSHELRTPLNAVLGWAVMLRSREASGGQPIDADLDHGLAVIERNARAQGKLIEDVLDVSRVVSGKFQLDRCPCDLGVLAFAAADAVRPAAQAKDITFEVRLDPKEGSGSLELLCDAGRVNQAILNLLNNAVKFTPMGGKVMVRLERGAGAEAGSGVARLVVSDTGRGIRSEFLPYVFDRFKQADEGSTRVFGGLGLGLTIVRHIAELHGGTITARSEGEGRGATFTLELPAQPVTPAATTGPTPTTTATGAQPLSERDGSALDVAITAPVQHFAVSLDNLRVLVVDDELDARTVTRMALEAAGATVVTASSAAEAHKLAIPEAPGAIMPFAPMDVLVSDLAMPGEDGYSLVRRLRAGGIKARDLPAVALTAFAGPEERRKALLAGFQVHISKPVDPHELIAVVGSLAGRTGV